MSGELIPSAASTTLCVVLSVSSLVHVTVSPTATFNDDGVNARFFCDALNVAADAVGALSTRLIVPGATTVSMAIARDTLDWRSRVRPDENMRGKYDERMDFLSFLPPRNEQHRHSG
jgi:hypothetical protein